jgi:3-phosphoinositide dependent protein kinase-1
MKIYFLNIYTFYIYIGIEYLHKKGYAHLDIKPENIVIDKNFDLKIADFGFA